MTQRPISVIIPTNRGGPYLAEAVASVRAQTVAADEVILVDDGSPEPGLSVIAAELGVAYVRKDAGGIASARNAGIDAAHGEWVAFLDDDDVWHPERLERQLEVLAEHPDAIASATGGWYLDESGTRFGDAWPQPAASATDMLGGRVPFPRITTVLVRRDAYIAVGGCDSAMEPSEDNDLILRLLTLGEFAMVDAPLVGYRRHRGNLTAARGLRGRAAGLRVIQHHRRLARRARDDRLVRLLDRNLTAFRRDAAAANVDDLVSALRRRRWAYAVEVAWWGARHVPAQSAGALAARFRDRRQRRAAAGRDR